MRAFLETVEELTVSEREAAYGTVHAVGKL